MGRDNVAAYGAISFFPVPPVLFGLAGAFLLSLPLPLKENERFGSPRASTGAPDFREQNFNATDLVQQVPQHFDDWFDVRTTPLRGDEIASAAT
jgi:hypothetical protein